MMSYVTHADIGGRDMPGAIVAEPEGEVFHADWEARVLALTLAMGGTGSWNIDASRSARETLSNYARLSYYQIWLEALESLLVERSQVLPDELSSGRMLHPPQPVKRVLHAADVPAALARGTSAERPATAPARFSIGQRVQTRAGHVEHHTRLPAYVQGKVGAIEHLHGMHVFADAHAQGLGEQPQWLYTVVFDGSALWGRTATPGLSVSIDAWESYLEPAP
jgi:nitrile hydratase beta subunit